MSREAEQTGPAGTPGEPYVVSAAVSGAHDQDAPDLRDATLALRETVQALRDRHRAEGWLEHDQWHLMRVSPDQKRTNRSWSTGDVDIAFWRESVAGVPADFDVVQLHNGWGEVALRAPSHQYVGHWRAASGFVTSPDTGVSDAADALVEWMTEAVATPGVRTGFVHADSVADPYGELVVLQSRLRSATMPGRVDGYYWTVALGPDHVEALGGADRLRQDGLCEAVTEADVGGEAGLVCRLTADPRDLTADRVRAWRQVLAPVLRPGFPGRLDMLWSRLAGLGRSVWLFEGMPTPPATLSVLSYGDVVEPPDIELVWQAADGSTVLDFELALEDEVTPALVACVAAVVRAWSVTGRYGELGDVPDPLDLNATDVRQEAGKTGACLVWSVRSDRPVTRAVADLLRSAIQEVVREIERIREFGEEPARDVPGLTDVSPPVPTTLTITRAGE